MKTRSLGRLQLLVLVALMILLAAGPALARGGGGGRGGKGGGGLGVLGALLYGAYCLVWRAVVMVRTWWTSQLLRKIARTDPAWDQEKLEEDVERIFYSLQQAWSDGQLGRVASLMQPSLKADWDRTLESYAAFGERNLLEAISLDSQTVIGISDLDGHREDRVMVLINGSCFDTMIDASTGEPLQNLYTRYCTKKTRSSFWEIWTFARDRDGDWVLAEISESVGISAILAGPCRSYDRRYLALHGGSWW